MSTSSFARVFLAGAVTLAALGGCSFTTEGELNTFSGEWCMLRGLGSSGLPRTADKHITMTLIQDGSLVLGNGSTKWPGSDDLHMSRFQGTIEGDRAVLTVSDLDPLVELPGPSFMIELRIVGSRDLEGTVSGDPGFAGSYQFVRLGPRCFFE